MAREIKVEKYYPAVLANAREFGDIADAENPEFKQLHTETEKWFKNGFVLDLDIDGAVRWEEMLKIRPKATDSLDVRRTRILIRINCPTPYTHRSLEQMLTAICGEGNSSVILDYNNYLFSVHLKSSNMIDTNYLGRFLRVIIPSNLTLKLAKQYYQTISVIPIIHGENHREILEIGPSKAKIKEKINIDCVAEIAIQRRVILPEANLRRQAEIKTQFDIKCHFRIGSYRREKVTDGVDFRSSVTILATGRADIAGVYKKINVKGG